MQKRNLVLIAALAAAGCASRANKPPTDASVELIQAEMAVFRASSGPAAEYAPADVAAAQRMLERAKRLAVRDPGSQEAEAVALHAFRLAIEAEQRAEVASEALVTPRYFEAADEPIGTRALPGRGGEAPAPRVERFEAPNTPNAGERGPAAGGGEALMDIQQALGGQGVRGEIERRRGFVEVELPTERYFVGRTGRLAPEAFVELDRIGQAMKAAPDSSVIVRIRLAGRAASDDEVALASQRAGSIARALVARGVEVLRVEQAMGPKLEGTRSLVELEFRPREPR